jgi:hypothetical protein
MIWVLNSCKFKIGERSKNILINKRNLLSLRIFKLVLFYQIMINHNRKKLMKKKKMNLIKFHFI